MAARDTAAHATGNDTSERLRAAQIVQVPAAPLGQPPPAAPRPASAGGRGCTARWAAPAGRPGLEEVADDQREHDVDVLRGHVAGQRPGREHRVDVEPVAARPDHQEQRVQPGARRRPASSSRRAQPCRRSRSSMLSSRTSVCTTVSPAVTSAKPAPAPPPRRGARQVRASAPRDVVPVRRPVRELVGEGVQRQVGRRGRELAATTSRASRQASSSAARHGRCGRPPLDVLDPEHHPVVVVGPQQPRGRHGGGQRRELAGLLAVGRRRTSSGRAPTPPSRSAASRPRR